MSTDTSLHATCVAVHGQGVVLMGDSGTGKSDLALRLIDRGAVLVADDRVELTHEGETLYARPAQRIQGMLEVRGIGLFSYPFQEVAPVSLMFRLCTLKEQERLSHPVYEEHSGIQLPVIYLYAFEPSAPLKVEKACQALRDNSLIVGALRE